MATRRRAMKMQRPNARPSACEELSLGFGGWVVGEGGVVLDAGEA